MHLLKVCLLLSIIIFVIISINNKVLTKRRVLHKHSKHNKHHKHHHFLNNKLHHKNKHGHHNLRLHHRQVQRLNPFLESDLCKISHTPRIVGGYRSNETSFSHVAALYECEAGATSINDCGFFCGGSIISKFHILTAAHCMFDNQTIPKQLENSKILVRIRVKDLLTPEENQGYYRTTFQVCRIFVHSGYEIDSPSISNDIALIKVVQPMIHGVPICINGLHFNYDLKARPNLIVAGWGTVASGGPLSNVLKYTYLYVSSCGYYDAGYFCAIAPYWENGFTCQGDSGSGVLPLKQNENAVNLIVGIVSAGSSTNSTLCIPPLFFTNVSTYAHWINEHVDK